MFFLVLEGESLCLVEPSTDLRRLGISASEFYCELEAVEASFFGTMMVASSAILMILAFLSPKWLGINITPSGLKKCL